MNRLVAGIAIAVVATTSYVAISTEAPDRPAGVSAKEWVSISNSLGIVLVSYGSPITPSGMPLLKPPVGGYFMVKGVGGWTRLVVIEPTKGPADVG
jgi:hypothetical protein